ncbi:MAG: SPFH/Band 7/PHB domain protein [Anaerolineaceae bacterium]|nr:SPFH/Band 7/PHB domain protein [Anaerolineaceae bacterium]
MFSFAPILIGLVAVIIFFFLAVSIRIVPEYQRLIVFRLGRSIGERGPGMVLLIPIVDRAVIVDLREQVREIPVQTSITQDNAPISIDFLWFYKVFDAGKTVMEVGNFELAAQGIATTTLRSVIGSIPLDGVLSEREQINNALRKRLDEVTERWGVKVTNVEIREIIPPREVQDSMNRQLAAERNRRAVVTESLGTREAAVNVADGEKRAVILKAEGAREAQLLNAEGYSNALEKIYSVAKNVESKTITLKYFETLKELGASPATKYIFPMEFTTLLKDFIEGRDKESKPGSRK